MRIYGLVGLQYGDEGKGRWADFLIDKWGVTHCVRYQGGPNAGHTIYKDGEKKVLHHLPAGALRFETCNIIGPGCVVDPESLVEEIKTIGVSKLWVSPKAHMITTKDSTETIIGTTRKGIGPTYANKVNRVGMRFENFKDNYTIIPNGLTQVDPRAFLFANGYIADFPIVDDATVLMEGAQGIMLDVDHGTYPYVTSSSIGTFSGCSSMGLDGRNVHIIYGVCKAYNTRVGNGPFSTEITDTPEGKYIADKGGEVGATTGRPRRIGWLDIDELTYAIKVSCTDTLILNKVDALSGLSSVFVKTGGEYVELPGWNLDKYNSHPNKGYRQLPVNLKDYIKFVQSETGKTIRFVGLGPNRDDFVRVEQ